MSHTFLAVLFAIGAAVCIAIGTVVRQRTAAVVPDDSIGALGPITTLVHSPIWWLGTIVGMVGYALQAAALGLGSLLLVQPLLVLSLLFALPLGARFSGRTISAREWLWAAALTTSVAVLIIVGDPRPGQPRAETHHWVMITLIGLPFVALCLFGAHRRTGSARALLLGIAGGSLFGVAAVLTKGVVHLVTLGPSAVLTSFEFYALVAVAAVATSVQQSAFQAGDLQASLPATTIMEPVIASLLGFVVLGEYLDADRKVAAVLALAVVAMVAATVALARNAADSAVSVPQKVR
ncbi:DMT family transporter [Rhodococcus globerulus]|uniref:DMT family transporter n=1 Tax=Rhodococcus globerulus TaxID=33008 RepID=UPI001F19C5A8|nr:DMT family transporter [Rhodococcus globerulus]MCE4268225.1 DMT family transporter [Rhodococcus globerulus]